MIRRRPRAKPGDAAEQGLPEPVVGIHSLRTFRVSEEGYFMPVSENGSPFSWMDGTCTAACRKQEDHPAPADDCTCGVYSFKEVETLRAQYVDAHRIVAVVALEGETVEGARGYRSSAARIVALWTGGLPLAKRGAVAARWPWLPQSETVGELIAPYPELSWGEPPPRRRTALPATLTLIPGLMLMTGFFIAIVLRAHNQPIPVKVAPTAIESAVSSQLHATVPPSSKTLLPPVTHRVYFLPLTVEGVTFPCQLNVTSAEPLKVTASCGGAVQVNLPASAKTILMKSYDK